MMKFDITVGTVALRVWAVIVLIIHVIWIRREEVLEDTQFVNIS